MLASLGALDQAFARADAYAADRSTTYAAQLFGTSFLFQTETAAMRQDPRFIPLVEKLGLLKYWREAKLAPDFCGYEPAPVCDALKF